MNRGCPPEGYQPYGLTAAGATTLREYVVVRWEGEKKKWSSLSNMKRDAAAGDSRVERISLWGEASPATVRSQAELQLQAKSLSLSTQQKVLGCFQRP